MLVDKEVPDAFVKSLYEDFRNLVLDPYTTDSGELHKKFIQVHQSQLSRLVGAKGSKLYKLTARDIRDMRRYYLDKIKDSASTKNTEQLKSYSNWLHGFKSSVEEVKKEYNWTNGEHPTNEMKLYRIWRYLVNTMVYPSRTLNSMLKLPTLMKEYCAYSQSENPSDFVSMVPMKRNTISWSRVVKI